MNGGKPMMVHTDIEKYSPDELCILYSALLEANKELRTQLVYKPRIVAEYLKGESMRSEETLLMAIETKMYTTESKLLIEV